MPMNRADYPPNWNEISAAIRRRAGPRCEWCNARNYQPHPDTGSKVVLTVAHIDHDTTNNDPSNLAALCQKCHNGHDVDHRVANRKYGKGRNGPHQQRLKL